MKRRDFLINSTLSAVAVSVTGFIRFDGKQFVGDCETTTDILGPYYRPNSPVRNNFIIPNEAGEPIELSGFIRHTDCTTPYKNAKIELWHCDSKGVYDNQSTDFRFRGTTYSDEKGFYAFKTTTPVPYGNEKSIRPAHFHLMITAEGYQPLITQLYFNGDAHIKTDPFAAAAKAQKRILDVQKTNLGVAKVQFDVSMAEKLRIEATALDKLLGIYTNEKDKKNTLELFKYNGDLWLKNEAFGSKFEYVGNNTFDEANNPDGQFWKLEFEILASGGIKIMQSYTENDLSMKFSVFLKDK